MGHKSQVVIAVVDQYVDEFEKLIEDIGLPDKSWDNKDGKMYMAHFESIKWYESDEPVENMMDFIYRMFDDEFAFVEIGEDNEEGIEMKGSPGKFGISVIRSIEIDA